MDSNKDIISTGIKEETQVTQKKIEERCARRIIREGSTESGCGSTLSSTLNAFSSSYNDCAGSIWRDERNDSPAYMPTICDGPRSLGSTRLTLQTTQPANQQEIVPDFFNLKESHEVGFPDIDLGSFSTNEENQSKAFSFDPAQFAKSNYSCSSINLDKEEKKS